LLRFVGAILLAGGAAAVGVRASLRLKTRLRVLSGLSAGIGLMRSELAFREPAIPELMETLAAETDSPVSDLFQCCARQSGRLGREPFSAIWESAVDQCEGLELTARECREIRVIGSILGRYDVEGQLAALAALQNRVEQLYSGAVREQENKGKVFGTMGLATGLGLVILLL